MIYEIVEMIGNIVDVTGIYIITNSLFQRKRGIKIRYIFFIIIIQSFAMRGLNILLGNSHWTILTLLILSSYLLCRKLFHLQRLKFAVSIVFYFLLVGIIEFLITILITKIYSIDNILLIPNDYRMVGILSSKIITIYIVVYVSKIFRMKKFKLEKYGVLTLIMMILSLTVFFIASGIYEENLQIGFQIIYIMVIAVMMALVSVLMLFVVRKIIEITEENTRFRAVEKEYKNHIKYLKKYDTIIKSMKERRHDYKNHLISISRLSTSGEDTKVSNYVNRLLKDEIKTEDIINIENKIISALINYNIKKIEKNSIKFYYNIELPEKIHVFDVDMTIIVGNLLDNAIEACKNIDSVNRYINMDIKYGYGKVYIIMKNSSPNEINIVNNHIDTTKTNKEKHGYGLENIRKTIEKYNGYFKIDSLNNEFIIEILL